jgi:hypothetical protein
MVVAFIRVIHGLTTYQVYYVKAWRAKEPAQSFLWGRLERSLCKSTEDVSAISYFNTRMKCVMDIGRK